MKKILSILLILFAFTSISYGQMYYPKLAKMTALDSMVTGDSIKTVSLKNVYSKTYLIIQNTSGSGTDTFYIANKVYKPNTTTLVDSLNIGGINTKTGLTENPLFVAQGVTTEYLLPDLIDRLVIRRKSFFQATNADRFYLRLESTRNE